MTRKLISVMLSVLLAWGGLVTQAAASIIDTPDALAVDSREARIADIQARLARDDVRQAMIELGVNPMDAQARVDSLSDQELVALQEQLDTLPAGSGLLALIGAVFVVLLILELIGVTDVFTKA